MIKLTVAEWTLLPPVPVMVRIYVPLGMLLLLSTVSTEVPESTRDVGENVAVARCGTPPAERFTVPENPGPAVMVTV